MSRHINEDGINLIKTFEGYRSEPYTDSAGIWTQGYGHTHGITANSSACTEEEAEQWLEDDLEDAERTVESGIHVLLNDNQFSALVSLVFNVGPSPLHLTLGRKLNQSDYTGAADEFQRWCHAGGKVVQGLVRRRDAEKSLFSKPAVSHFEFNAEKAL